MEPVVLWENPDPTKPFPETVITLSNAEYNYYAVYYKPSGNYLMREDSIKGYGICLVYPSISSGSANNYRRIIRFLSDTELLVEESKNNITSAVNSTCIPIRIIGYKS